MESLLKMLMDEYHAAPNCDGIKGTESVEELIAFMFKGGGMKYCVDRKFPSLEMWRAYAKTTDLTKFGVYVDAGKIRVANRRKVVIVGKTRAMLHYDQNISHKVLAMHGATANITAEKWGLVIVRASDDCKIRQTLKDNAKIL
jgi:hypothetical protein